MVINGRMRARRVQLMTITAEQSTIGAPGPDSRRDYQSDQCGCAAQGPATP